MSETNLMDQIRDAASSVGETLDADVFVYFGGIYTEQERLLTSAVREANRRKNAFLFLCTSGGEAESAFRIARCLQAQYSSGRFILFVDHVCKSAGTMIALGANEIIMSDRAELGPLDVQLRKRDEIEERMSGLTTNQALTTLRGEVFNSFEDFFLKLRFRSGMQITTRTAVEMAAKLAVGLFAPIYGQIDPLALGENQRAMLIAEKYGQRLATVGRNLKRDSLDKLIADYPSHDFVIERTEAKEIFQNVRTPNDQEKTLAELVFEYSDDVLNGMAEPIVFLASREKMELQQNSTTTGEPANDYFPPATEPQHIQAEDGRNGVPAARANETFSGDRGFQKNGSTENN